MSFRRFASLLSAMLPAAACCLAATPRVHQVALGPVRRVPFVAADVSSEARGEEAGTLRIRSLTVDGRLREWTTGDQHDLTDRSFVTRRVLHINDALPGEKTGRWVWQPGPWLLVDRVSGRIAALHMPDFDSSISEVTWYRDYAAYCGIRAVAKSSGVSANVWQIGAHRAALQKIISPWPQPVRMRPVCAAAVWQREPMRVTLRATGGEPLVFDVVGTSTLLVEDGEGGDDDN